MDKSARPASASSSPRSPGAWRDRRGGGSRPAACSATTGRLPSPSEGREGQDARHRDEDPSSHRSRDPADLVGLPDFKSMRGRCWSRRARRRADRRPAEPGDAGDPGAAGGEGRGPTMVSCRWRHVGGRPAEVCEIAMAARGARSRSGQGSPGASRRDRTITVPGRAAGPARPSPPARRAGGRDSPR